MNGGTLDSEVVMFFYLISQLPLARQSVDAFLIQVFSAELGAPSTSDGPGAGVSNAWQSFCYTRHRLLDQADILLTAVVVL